MIAPKDKLLNAVDFPFRIRNPAHPKDPRMAVTRIDMEIGTLPRKVATLNVPQIPRLTGHDTEITIMAALNRSLSKEIEQRGR